MARKAAPEKIVCPISGATLEYRGRGRPPVYHPNISKAVRRAHNSGRRVGRDASGVFVILA